MSFIDAIRRAEKDYTPIDREKIARQKREDMMAEHNHNKYWTEFFKARVKDFALETNNELVKRAYHQMINGSNTDSFYSENNFISK